MALVYSAYGEVEVEHMGPRYGPMGGQEMVYAVLKGRILKSDIRVEVVDHATGWHHHVETFTKNGSVIYFLMPAYPHPQLGSARVEIVVFYKEDELFRSTYLYQGSLDRTSRCPLRSVKCFCLCPITEDLAALRLSDRITTADPTPPLNPFNPLAFMSATGVFPKRNSGKSATATRRKRLGH